MAQEALIGSTSRQHQQFTPSLRLSLSTLRRHLLFLLGSTLRQHLAFLSGSTLRQFLLFLSWSSSREHQQFSLSLRLSLKTSRLHLEWQI